MAFANCSSMPFSVNGRIYQPPARPIVVICIDGCTDEYLGADWSLRLATQSAG